MTTEVLAGAERFLFSKVRSWFMGMNTNLPDRQRPRFLLYAGGLPQFRQRCADEAAAGYPGFDFG